MPMDWGPLIKSGAIVVAIMIAAALLLFVFDRFGPMPLQ